MSIGFGTGRRKYSGQSNRLRERARAYKSGRNNIEGGDGELIYGNQPGTYCHVREADAAKDDPWLAMLPIITVMTNLYFLDFYDNAYPIITDGSTTEAEFNQAVGSVRARVLASDANVRGQMVASMNALLRGEETLEHLLQRRYYAVQMPHESSGDWGSPIPPNLPWPAVSRANGYRPAMVKGLEKGESYNEGIASQGGGESFGLLNIAPICARWDAYASEAVTTMAQTQRLGPLPNYQENNPSVWWTNQFGPWANWAGRFGNATVCLLNEAEGIAPWNAPVYPDDNYISHEQVISWEGNIQFLFKDEQFGT